MTEMEWRTDEIGTVDGFLSAAECDAYIRWGETIGFDEATVTTPRGLVTMKHVRNNDRVMVDDPERARALYERLSIHLGARLQQVWTPIGLNELLRLYRYDVGQQFDWHRDGHFERSREERSFFTFMIYLNDDFEGGATSFSVDDTGVAPDGVLRVVPKKGMALLFHHPIMHRGDPVTTGRKYVLRTDVMYARCE
jgi:catechol 2,3-dioxygenase-like lactoylglutathione lyase family enzyme